MTSDIPALVLYGLNDTQTSSADALDTAANLGNARALGFPEAGHGALIFSQCAKDIGAAFLESADQRVDQPVMDGLAHSTDEFLVGPVLVPFELHLRCCPPEAAVKDLVGGGHRRDGLKFHCGST